MAELSALITLFDSESERPLPLPPELRSIYGQLSFPPHPGRPHVISNFVTTLDGVVSLNVTGQSGGGEISGHNQHDRFVMGLLRAVSDAVIVGAGTLRAVPNHLWTAQFIFPPMAEAYRSLRARLGKSGHPLTVIVTGHGDLNLGLPVFQTPDVPALVVTSSLGAHKLGPLPPSVRVEAIQESERVTAAAILDLVDRVLGKQSDIVLVEGGPHLLGDFVAEERLDELFLTLAPQVAGRDDSNARPGLIEGKRFAPEHPVWTELISLRRAESHLFLRYSLKPMSEGTTASPSL